MKQSLKRTLAVLPISLLLLAGCGDDDSTPSDDASQVAGSEDGASDDASDAGDESGDEDGDEDAGDDASGESDSGESDSSDDAGAAPGLDESTDLCSLVSEETLAASGLTPADGGVRDRMGVPACVWDNLDRVISVAVDFDHTLGAIDEYSQDAEEMNGRQVQVRYDTEMTCLYTFTLGEETAVDVVVEDDDPAGTPGEPCDAGRAALDDVMESIG